MGVVVNYSPMNTETLRKWFLSESRELPWRSNITPYGVWVSEVMLQQTQVAVVIPYYERWMKLFPTIKALSEAPVEAVLKAWEGLGYYSRARNLHEGAKYVVEHFNGELPDEEQELLKIKGIGHYTVGAILSFAFHKKKAAVDGNVLRVIARHHALHDDISKAKTVMNIKELAEALLPDHEPWVISEALIELGATVCTKKAKCGECPLKVSCQAFVKGSVDLLPVKTGQVKTTALFRPVAVVVCQSHILVRKGEKGKVMADLYEFPYIELSDRPADVSHAKAAFEKLFDIKLKVVQSLPEVKHSFTRYSAQLFPVCYTTLSCASLQGYEWISFEEIVKLPFSSGHKRILHAFMSEKICPEGLQVL